MVGFIHSQKAAREKVGPANAAKPEGAGRDTEIIHYIL